MKRKINCCVKRSWKKQRLDSNTSDVAQSITSIEEHHLRVLPHRLILKILEFTTMSSTWNIAITPSYPYSSTQRFPKRIEFGYFKNDPFKTPHLLTRHLQLGGDYEQDEYWKLLIAIKNSLSLVTTSLPCENAASSKDCIRVLVSGICQNPYLETIGYLQTDRFVNSYLDACLSVKERNPWVVNGVDTIQTVYVHTPYRLTHHSISRLLLCLQNLRQFYIKSMDLSNLIPSDFDCAVHRNKLTRLDLSGTRVKDEVVLKVLQIRSLCQLNLNRATNLQNNTLIAVCSHALKFLSLGGNSLPHVCFELLAKNEFLRNLNLDHANLNNRRLQILLESPFLVEFSAVQPFMIGQLITDGLTPLSKNRSLKELDLSGWAVEQLQPIFCKHSLDHLTLGDEDNDTLMNLLQNHSHQLSSLTVRKLTIKSESPNHCVLALRKLLPNHTELNVTHFYERVQ